MVTRSSTYAQRLSEAIAAKGVTKSELARHLGISPQALSHVFTGHTRSFTAENNVRAATFLGVDSAWLAAGDSAPGRSTDVTQTLSGLESDVINVFRQLSAARQLEVAAYVRSKAGEQALQLNAVSAKLAKHELGDAGEA